MVEEEEEFFYGGIIEGEQKKEEEDYLDEYMLSTVSSIKEELIINFPQETSDFYVYTKYSQKDRILKIFVSLNRASSINHREMNINFLMIVNEEFPNKPPLIFCLTDVNNIIYNLIHFNINLV
jgi:hypothetical protein